MLETATGRPAATRKLWDLSELDLAESCRQISEGRVSGCGSMLRAEAMRLFLLWMEAMSDSADADEREQRAALISGLRKRTIQILVRLMMTN